MAKQKTLERAQKLLELKQAKMALRMKKLRNKHNRKAKLLLQKQQSRVISAQTNSGSGEKVIGNDYDDIVRVEVVLETSAAASFYTTPKVPQGSS
jgi:hypothetical protein